MAAADRPPALIVAIVGAESTGKTALAAVLAERIARNVGVACCWVPEHLRGWCALHGRTPRRDEQPAIAAAQQAAIEAAAATHAVVVCDTTPLMTAVYSRLLFDDNGLTAPAAAWQRRCGVTLLTALDLPWVADGLQRDGPQVQAPVDTLLRQLLLRHGLAFSVIHGGGERRVDAALAALPAALLQPRQPPADHRPLRLPLPDGGESGDAAADAGPLHWRCCDCD